MCIRDRDNTMENVGPYEKHTRGISASNSKTTHFGLKGQEDLSGGTVAEFNVEYAMPASDKGDATVRKTWVGLSNKEWGSLRIGQQETRSNELLALNEVLEGTSNVAGSITAISDHKHYMPMLRYSFTNNGITFSAAAGKTHESQETRDTKGKIVEQRVNNKMVDSIQTGSHFEEIAINNTGSAAKFGLSYFQEKKAQANHKDTMWIFTTSYDAGFVVPHYTYMQKKGDMGIYTGFETKVEKDTANVTGYQPHEVSTNSTGKYHQIGVVVMPEEKLSYHVNYFKGSVDGVQTGIEDKDNTFHRHLNGYQLGAKYKLSKRTNMYAMYGVNTYKDFEFKDKTKGNSVKSETITVGLKHSF
jgi:predicted porin